MKFFKVLENQFKEKFSNYSLSKRHEYSQKGSKLTITGVSEAIEDKTKNAVEYGEKFKGFSERGTLIHDLILEHEDLSKLSKFDINSINEEIRRYNSLENRYKGLEDIPEYDMVNDFWKSLNEMSQKFKNDYKKEANLVEQIIGIDQIAGKLDLLSLTGVLNNSNNPIVNLNDLKVTSTDRNLWKIDSKQKNGVFKIGDIEIDLTRVNQGLLKNQIYIEIMNRSKIKQDVQDNSLILMNLSIKNKFGSMDFVEIKLSDLNEDLQDKIIEAAKAIVDENIEQKDNPGNIDFDFDHEYVGKIFRDNRIIDGQSNPGRYVTIYAAESVPGKKIEGNTTLYTDNTGENWITDSQITAGHYYEHQPKIVFSKGGVKTKSEAYRDHMQQRFEIEGELFSYSGNPLFNEFYTGRSGNDLIEEIADYQLAIEDLINQIKQGRDVTLDLNFEENFKVYDASTNEFVDEKNGLIASFDGLAVAFLPKPELKKKGKKIDDIIEPDPIAYSSLNEENVEKFRALVKDDPINQRLFQIRYDVIQRQAEGQASTAILSNFERDYSRVKYSENLQNRQSLKSFLDEME